jgi:riboflavin biosynthesis pyrimidine reductase
LDTLTKRPYVVANFVTSWDGVILDPGSADQPDLLVEQVEADVVLRNSEIRAANVSREAAPKAAYWVADRLPEGVRHVLESSAWWKAGATDDGELVRGLEHLASEFGVKCVVLEACGELFARALRERCVDELCLKLRPRIVGGKKHETLTPLSPSTWLTKSVSTTSLSMEVLGNECVTRWRLLY